MGIFQWVGLGEVSGVDILFAATALIGGLLFLLWFILMFIVGGLGDAVGGAFDIDVGMDADLSFKAMTFQGITSFFMMFGLVGLAVSRSESSALIAILAGTAAGASSMYIMGKLFATFQQLQSSGTAVMSNAIGSRGTVYLTIKPGEHGKVQVELQGSMRTLDAVGADKKRNYPTGEFIKVTDTISSTMIVAAIQEEE